jgi:glycerophosphoryl diester phosphodiesterase
MSLLDDCAQKRIEKCTKKGRVERQECIEYRDEGYATCTQSRDEGYRDCCDWWPCSWACKAWVWVSHIVCVVWTWISNVVCVVWRTIVEVLCLVWVVTSIPVCVVSPAVTRWLDRGLQVITDVVSKIIGGIVGIAEAVIYAIFHPVETVGTIIDLFHGCPDWSMNRNGSVRVIAHHGYIKHFPENTAQSCLWALRKGADALEIDLCITSDGQVVLWHDWDPDDVVSLARQSGQPGEMAYYLDVPPIGSEWRRPVGELTLGELRQHYGYRNVEDAVVRKRHDIEYGHRDLTIPTFSEFMAEARQWATLKLLCLDVKVPVAGRKFAAQLTDAIHEALPSYRDYAVVVMVPSYAVLVSMKARSEERGYGLVFSWDVEFPGGFSINPLRYSAVDHAVVNELHNSAASVGRLVGIGAWLAYKRVIGYDIKRANEVNGDPGARNAGQRIDYLIAWTVNEEDELKCLVRTNVSGVITDEIELMRRIVGS